MKIFLFIPTLEIGGAEIITINLCNYYYEKGHSITLIVNNTGPLLCQLNHGINIFILNKKRLRFSLLKLYYFILVQQPDLLFSMVRDSNILSIILFYLPFLRTKLVIREAGLLETGDYSYLTNLIMKICYRSHSNIIFNSRGTYESFKQANWLKNKSFKIISNPIINNLYYSKCNEECSHKWFLVKELIIITSIARLDIIKDHKTMIHAFNLIHKRNSKTRLIIIGDGPNRKNIEALIKLLSLQDVIDLVGFQDNPFKYLRYSHIFIHTPLVEGFGNVIVEALGFGLPIVTTNAPGGISDILENGKYGILCDVGDSNDVSEAILRLINNEIYFNKTKLIERSHEFRVDKIAEEYLNKYLII